MPQGWKKVKESQGDILEGLGGDKDARHDEEETCGVSDFRHMGFEF